MSDLTIKRKAYLDWIAAEGPHQAHVPDAVDAYVAALEAHAAELGGDPRLALTRDDLNALVTGYGFWWRGPDEVHNPSALIDKTITVLAALAAEGRDDT